jgi:hypothetical protein
MSHLLQPKVDYGKDRIFGERRKQLNQISLFAWGNGSRSARDVERFCAKG